MQTKCTDKHATSHNYCSIKAEKDSYTQDSICYSQILKIQWSKHSHRASDAIQVILSNTLFTVLGGGGGICMEFFNC